MNAKRLALLHELLPKAVRIAVLVNPANIPGHAVETAIPFMKSRRRVCFWHLAVMFLELSDVCFRG